MGVYLSTPCREVEGGQGEGAGLRFGFGEMQGWRRSMEDAHVTIANLAEARDGDDNSDEDASLFAVFDGHGGKEVAKFCQDHLASVLTGSAQYKEKNYEDALKFAFHHLDVLLEDETNESKLERYRQIPNPAQKLEGELDTNMSTPQEHGEDEEDQVGFKNGNVVLTQEQVMQLIQSMYGPVRTVTDNGDNHDDEENEDGKEGHDDDHKEEHEESDEGHPEAANEEPVAASNPAGQSVDDSAVGAQKNPSDELSPAMNALSLENGPARPAPQPVRNIHGCTLADHRVIAGCTAVVAYRKGNVMYVANAGDSRAVLCRAGTAIPLSVDHKPCQQRERRRIVNAGGFVNPVGRVNGNLNLSRSIGDLKYKKNKDVSRPDQIISAEPDVVRVELTNADEFLILGCDGIWDCKTNQEAVDFVRERLLRGMSLQDITEAMCHDCLADDPRRTTGIGADNMTFVVVEFANRENWPAPPADMLNVPLPDPEL